MAMENNIDNILEPGGVFRRCVAYLLLLEKQGSKGKDDGTYFLLWDDLGATLKIYIPSFLELE